MVNDELDVLATAVADRVRLERREAEERQQRQHLEAEVAGIRARIDALQHALHVLAAEALDPESARVFGIVLGEALERWHKQARAALSNPGHERRFLDPLAATLDQLERVAAADLAAACQARLAALA